MLKTINFFPPLRFYVLGQRTGLIINFLVIAEYWDRLEEYVEKHSDAVLTRSICEDCADKLYGNGKWYKK